MRELEFSLEKKTNNNDDSKNLIAHGKLKLDPNQLECEWNGKSLPEKLTTTEFLIVKELAKRPGVIKERAHLMDIAYKENTDIEDRTIDSHIKRIRKKFKKLMRNFPQSKLGMEVVIDGILINEVSKSSSSILRKFLVFNFFIFLFLGSLTFFYLSGIQPNLVKQRMEKHTVIINNTSNHLERLSIEFDKESLKNFLLSTRFLFQNLERVQFYDITGNLIADTNVLDLDQSVFTKTEIVMEEDIKDKNIKKLTDKDNLKNDLNTSSNINSLKEIIIK